MAIMDYIRHPVRGTRWRGLVFTTLAGLAAAGAIRYPETSKEISDYLGQREEERIAPYREAWNQQQKLIGANKKARIEDKNKLASTQAEVTKNQKVYEASLAQATKALNNTKDAVTQLQTQNQELITQLQQAQQAGGQPSQVQSDLEERLMESERQLAGFQKIIAQQSGQLVYQQAELAKYQISGAQPIPQVPIPSQPVPVPSVATPKPQVPSPVSPKVGENYEHTVVKGNTPLGVFFDLYSHGAKGKGLVKIVADYNAKNGLNINPNTVFSNDTVIAYPLYYGSDVSDIGFVKVTAKNGQSLSRVVNETWVKLYQKFADGNELDVDNVSVRSRYRTESRVLFKKSDEPFDWGEALVDGEVTQEYAQKHKPQILGVISEKHIPAYKKSRSGDGLKEGSSKNKGYLSIGQKLNFVSPEGIEVVGASQTSPANPQQTSMYQNDGTEATAYNGNDATKGIKVVALNTQSNPANSLGSASRTLEERTKRAYRVPNDPFFDRFMKESQRYAVEMGYRA